MPELLIIDGSSMLSTSYYGNLPKSILFAKTEEEKAAHYKEILHTSDGKYTNAMFTMLRTLISVYKKVQPDYLAFVFDMTRDTFRRTELGADFYKANRKETAQPLKEQFVQMEEFLNEIGCPVFMSREYEADDYAASLVRKFEGPELNTYVLTKDHDYYQLVSDYTRMWRVVTKDKLETLKDAYGLYGKEGYDVLPPNVFEYTRDIVYAEEGVYPEQIPVLLAITGDPGDGIPGCKGVSSAAAPLVAEYKTLDRIYGAIDKCQGIAKKEKELSTFWKECLGIGRSPLKALKTNREMVYLSEKLAEMKDDIPLSCTLEDLKFHVDMPKLKELLKQYEMNSILSDVEKLCNA
nr:5'-3' exonuclease H3TH domain-containing protein [uncultured Blautia sp.]